MKTNKSPFTDVETAIADLRAGRMIVVVDDEDRENEGDLTIAAEKITPEAINFMAKYGRGLVCLPMTGERLDYLRLQPMTANNTSPLGTAFTESIDAMGRGVTTGISAYDRAQTILCAIDPATTPSDLARPGHVFPLRARRGGVLVRGGQTEAAVDLTRLAGMVPAGVICEIMNDDGTMARVPQLAEFCRRHNLKMVSVAALVRYRMAHERHVRAVGESVLSTPYGDFRMIAYCSDVHGSSHLALLHGEPEEGKPVLVHLHKHCLAGDLLGDTSCKCGPMLHAAMREIAAEGSGLLVYLDQNATGFSVLDTEESRSLAFHQKARNTGAGTKENRLEHEACIGAQILADLNIQRVRLLISDSQQLPKLEGFGIEVVESVPLTETEGDIAPTNGVAWREALHFPDPFSYPAAKSMHR
jgi:3,4-dihydroxy 2-butanone 4-phosphate synthase / GTP cyclohydrolase II